MRPELALQLKITSCEQLIQAIAAEIKKFTDEQKSEGYDLSPRDQEASFAITDHLQRGITNGEILRQDLKTILRNIYGRVGRFYYTLPRRLEALRNLPEFSPEALRRGYSQIRQPDSHLLELQLQKQHYEKEALIHEKKQLADELKATTEDQLVILEENTALKKQLLARDEIARAQELALQRLQKRCGEYSAFIQQSGLPIPAHLSAPLDIVTPALKTKPWSWSSAVPAMSPTLFTIDPATSLPVPTAALTASAGVSPC